MTSTIHPRTGESLVAWYTIRQPHPGRQIVAKVYRPDGTVKLPEFPVAQTAVAVRVIPQVAIQSATGQMIFAYHFLDFAERTWELRGKVLDSAGNPVGLDSPLNVCEPPLNCSDEIRTPGEFYLTRKAVEGNLGIPYNNGSSFRMNCHQASGLMAITYVKDPLGDSPALWGKTCEGIRLAVPIRGVCGAEHSPREKEKGQSSIMNGIHRSPTRTKVARNVRAPIRIALAERNAHGLTDRRDHRPDRECAGSPPPGDPADRTPENCAWGRDHGGLPRLETAAGPCQHQHSIYKDMLGGEL